MFRAEPLRAAGNEGHQRESCESVGERVRPDRGPRKGLRAEDKKLTGHEDRGGGRHQRAADHDEVHRRAHAVEAPGPARGTRERERSDQRDGAIHEVLKHRRSDGHIEQRKLREEMDG